MAEKMLYVLAGYDEKTEEKLQTWQNMLYDAGFVGTQTKNIPQHITLGSFPVDMEEELCALVDKAGRETGPLPVTFNHVGIFGGGKVLFIAPDVSKEMLDLKEKFGESRGWTAHSTMLIDAPDVTLRAAGHILKGFASFEGKITQLFLYEFFPARHIATIQLKG